WCGQPDAQARVLANLDSMAIAGAFDDALPDFGARQQLLPADLAANDRERLRKDIETRGLDYVGQEVVQLSTTPVWRDRRPGARRVRAGLFPPAAQGGVPRQAGGFLPPPRPPGRARRPRGRGRAVGGRRVSLAAPRREGAAAAGRGGGKVPPRPGHPPEPCRR